MPEEAPKYVASNVIPIIPIPMNVGKSCIVFLFIWDFYNNQKWPRVAKG